MTQNDTTTATPQVTRVHLTELQKAQRDILELQWEETLIVMARDDSDPEAQANAQAYLSNRGISW